MGGAMRRLGVLLVCFVILASIAEAADLSTSSSQELLATYKQLRSIQGGSQSASTENVIFKRDAATFTFNNGRITFAEPVAGRVLAAHFQGEAKFELAPPSPLDQRQIKRFAGNEKLTDTFTEAVFFFTDDSFEELSRLTKIRTTPKATDAPFASRQKYFSENYNNWIENSVRKKAPVMKNMAARMLADLTDSSSKGFFVAEFRGSRSGDLLFQISWNGDSLLNPYLTSGDEITLLHVKPGEWHEFWAGFHLSAEYSKSPHPDHRNLLVHSPVTKIDLQIGKDNRISAAAEMEYVVRSPARVLPFSLNNVLRISAIEDSAGAQLTFIQEDRKLDNDPWVILAAPAKPGEKSKIKILYKEDSTYESHIIDDHESGLFAIAGTAAVNWYPSFGSFDDRTVYEVTARLPKRFTFVGSGLTISSVKENDDLVTSWKSEIPVNTTGFNYGVLVDSSQGSPDMKITAYTGRELPKSLRALETMTSQMTMNQGSRSEAMLIRGGLNTTSTVKSMGLMGIQSLKLFEFLFGKLPFKNVALMGLEGGGAWPNIVTLPFTTFLDSTTQNQLGMTGSGEMRLFNKVAVPQGIAQQWWDHLINGKTYHDTWISDGAKDFAALMYVRQFEPNVVDEFRDIRRKHLLSKNAKGYRPVDAGPIWLNRQLNEWDQNNTFVAIPYKGGYIFDMIRVLMYDRKLPNPDGHFIAMMHEFTSTYGGKNVSTEEFRQLVEKYLRQPMDWFFSQWVYGSETPSYDFSYQLKNADGGATELAISLKQSGVSDSFRMKLPLYAVVKGEKQFLGLVETVGTQPVQKSVKLPLRPEKILLDPERNILAEIHQ